MRRVILVIQNWSFPIIALHVCKEVETGSHIAGVMQASLAQAGNDWFQAPLAKLKLANKELQIAICGLQTARGLYHTFTQEGAASLEKIGFDLSGMRGVTKEMMCSGAPDDEMGLRWEELLDMAPNPGLGAILDLEAVSDREQEAPYQG